MRLRYRNGAPLYGKTLQTVLAERPCRVIVVADPAETATDGAAAAAAPARPRPRIAAMAAARARSTAASTRVVRAWSSSASGS